jgi:hypothetical protein
MFLRLQRTSQKLRYWCRQTAPVPKLSGPRDAIDIESGLRLRARIPQNQRDDIGPRRSNVVLESKQKSDESAQRGTKQYPPAGLSVVRRPVAVYDAKAERVLSRRN